MSTWNPHCPSTQDDSTTISPLLTNYNPTTTYHPITAHHFHDFSILPPFFQRCSPRSVYSLSHPKLICSVPKLTHPIGPPIKFAKGKIKTVAFSHIANTRRNYKLKTKSEIATRKRKILITHTLKLNIQLLFAWFHTHKKHKIAK